MTSEYYRKNANYIKFCSQKSFVAILALVAVAAADVSHIVRGGEADAQILRQDADVLPDSFSYAYETSNGIAAQEQGQLKNVGTVSTFLAF